jgi:biotin transport system substrate-specific component
MSVAFLANQYLRYRYLFFKWRCSLALLHKLCLAFCMACLTGLLAQIRVYLPFTPVPVTGQVLGVLLSGVICGGAFGAVSQIIYVGLGIFGVPWFAAGKGGITYLLTSPTIGYLIGFIIVPLVIGGYTDKYIKARTFLSQMKLMLLGVSIIYFFGAIGLAISMKLGLYEVILKGVLPFIPLDLVKAAVASSISFSILPKTSYNDEIDKGF